MEITHAAWAAPAEERAGRPVVVALHGRGADEVGMLALAPYLPAGVTLVALRAPIAEGGGYAWFRNRGIGRPVEESIKEVAAAVRSWLDANVTEPAFLLGFSGGTAMAGGLLLEAPDRYAGAVLLSGTLPWDAGFDTADGVLDAVPVFWANDPADPVIPRELVDRSEAWLRGHSGAALEERHYPGTGHGMTAQELADVSAFLRPLLGVES